MFLAKILFGSSNNKEFEIQDLKELAQSFLFDVKKGGLILEDFLIGGEKNNIVAYVYLSRPDSLSEKYLEEYYQDYSYKKLLEAFKIRPSIEIIEEDIPKNFTKWEDSKFLYLAITTFDNDSPIRKGNSGISIPTYLLPLSRKEREGIIFWSSYYKSCNLIWINSEGLEMECYKEMVDPHSKLSRIGIEICKNIEAKTKIPTYYYLERYYGRDNEEEKNRPCPNCGDNWRIFNNKVDSYVNGKFTFICKKCRLISNLPDSFEDERHARIGEFYKIKNDTIK